jgi:hypothetical protein
LPGADFQLETIELDLPAFAGALGARLRRAGLPVSAEVSARFAAALTLVRPVSRRRLYWTARAVFVSDRAHVKPFDAVFTEVFGGGSVAGEVSADVAQTSQQTASGLDSPGSAAPATGPATPSLASAEDAGEHGDEAEEVPVALGPSQEEVLREKRFDRLSPQELAELYELMSRMTVAAPPRRTRRADRRRHGERIDLRRTLRDSLRTGGDPARLRRRQRRVVPRRIVMLCDISGSMEPYARAYLQFLTCARGAEAFVFATRLTRVTRALASRNPDRAMQNAAAAAPDWSSGTRIGDALKAFIDRHGRRGMARGAVVVILSDGWERGDPAVVTAEMQRLRRLAHRIVWVNPRAASDEFAPRAGGMAAALPYCDALVSGHNLASLAEVVDAIAGPGEPPPRVDVEAEEKEPWASATPVAGSSVAMPSGYGPKRGHTTPGWTQ